MTTSESPHTRSERLARWQRVMNVPLLVAAVLFLAVYSLRVLAPPHGGLAALATVVLAATYLLFGVDYVVALALADRRLRWFLHHLPELATLVLPFLRPLALLRLVTLLRVFNRAGGGVLRGRTTLYLVGAVVLIVYTGSLAELSAERNAPGATITSFGDALWWSIVTITTVGYGDYSPVTVLGRIVAVGLMLSGIAVIGVVTATVASWFVQQSAAATAAVDQDPPQQLTQQVAALTAEVQRLRQRLDADGGQSTRPSA